MDILVATTNKHKLREISEIFGKEHNILGFSDIGRSFPEVVEDGADFKENAAKKACEISNYVDIAVIADDSGLEVDALNGAPGVYSARYAGPEKDDAKNREKLLRDMAGIPAEKRSARFKAAIALAKGGRLLELVEGVCEGNITFEERGENGFGYDPVFQPAGYDMTFAEMNPEEKNRISHRYKGLSSMAKRLSGIIMNDEF